MQTMKPALHPAKRCCLLLIVLPLSLLLSCGGGGGDSSSTTLTSLSYSGSTEKAVIDAANAVDITTEAFNGGMSGTLFNNFASLSGSTDLSQARRHTTLTTALILNGAICDLHSLSPSPVDARAVVTEQETINGACGGQASGQLQIDDVSGSFTGILTFSNYCDSEVTLNGSANFSGTINLTTDTFETIFLNFDYLVTTYPTESYVFDGSITITPQSAGFILSMDMLLKSGADEVFWVNDCTIAVTDYGSTLSMHISGTFYDPWYGYVTLTTQEAIVIDAYDGTPTAGVLIATGENGTAGGATRARLTCYSSGMFQVDADTSGDGTYDWQSEMLTWGEY